ncbi:MAG TPA: ATP-dependent DNA helicase RecG, partial [Patescibacteria group bacterium]|nr:ATP-dependent DNA helicase RecG [Patescibacteria group bacterium]
RIGLRTVRDLLLWLPRRYDDLRTVYDLGSLRFLEPDRVVSARARVVSLRQGRTSRRRTPVVTAVLTDGTGTAEAQWYGRQYVERRLLPGGDYLFSGRLKKHGFGILLDNPAFQSPDGDLLHVGRIVPVYRLTEGLALRRLRAAIRAALDRVPPYAEYLPAGVLAAEQLDGIAFALEQAHFPDDFALRDAALRRLAFDELLALQVGMVARRRQRIAAAAVRVSTPDDRDRAIRAALVAALGARLGFDVELTADQAAAMDDIRRDMAGHHPMLRLLQGDVGSGKTAVAAYALAAAAEAGVQGALLAPTDLLARQHAVTLGDLLAPLGIPVTMLTGSLSGPAAGAALEAIADGRAAVIVGTHALFSERVRYADLGLVVVDEQHRFGVEQRGALEAKTTQGAAHVLLMTGTPIPRTVGQVVYADLEVTNLRSVPAGRVPIRTGMRRPGDLDGTWAQARREAADGRRTFVVVPRIEEGGDDDDENVAGAKAEADRLTTLLAPLRVGLVHGGQRAAARDRTMAQFRDGELDVLVGTTVVEVGVDVPEASLMVIESADRFGLAQLHQLRGRVGRGTAASYCVLVSDAADDSIAMERLRAVVRISDGFELAETDFLLRREGDVLGLAQSGLPRLRVATLARPDHRELAVAARRHAEGLLDAQGAFRQTAAPLARELREGWLARTFAADPASGA